MSIDEYPKNSTRNHLKAINLNEISLKKSSSYQNLKSTFTKNRLPKASNPTSIDANSKMPINIFYRKRNSTQNLSSFTENTQSSSFSRLSQELASGDIDQSFIENEQMQLNANRISVNSDLLSRVEKEKREYENRISDLTQLTESRKMEIEKLTFELRNCREEMQKATKLASSAILEANELRNQMELAGIAPEVLRTFQVDDRTLTNFKDCSSIMENTGSISHSHSESGTTNTNQLTRENAGLTNLSSLSSDWNDLNRLVSIYGSDFGNPAPANVANLQGKLQQMEEDNYTTNEELQATMQELGDLQRSLDEAQESNRSLAFEREILLESLCTQTTKLEHCRLQISQLKQLLLTNREALTAGTREAHFCEIFASIDQEKQALLAQNSDLAQSSDSLAQECRNLNEKLAVLQSKYEALEAQHTSLATALAGEFIKSQSNEEEQGSSVNHGVEWLANLKQQTEQAVEQVRSEMGQRILTMQEEMDSLKDQLDLARVEHEREATEWKLYERDLLKTVRVADGIKTEVEEELRRLATENHTLRDQIKTLQDELKRLNGNLELVLSSSPSLSSSGSSATVVASSPTKLVSSGGHSPKTSPIKSITPPKTATSTPTSNFLHRHYRATIHSISPAGGHHHPSIPLSNGTTVRNLIQSIENQVKAVHQQKLQQQQASEQNSVLRSPSVLSSRFASSQATTSTSSLGRSPSLCVASNQSEPVHSSATLPHRLQQDSTSYVPETKKLREIKKRDVPEDSSVAPGGPPQKMHSSTPSECRGGRKLSNVAAMAATWNAISESKQSSPKVHSSGSNPSNCVAANAGTSSALFSGPVATSTGATDLPTQHNHPLQDLVRKTKAGSKRNALLKWCQMQTDGYQGVEVNNFSSSWNNGLAFCALLHTFVPDRVPWKELITTNGLPVDKKRCFEVAFEAAQSVGIETTLSLNDMLNTDRPDWSSVMAYIASIYVHFNKETHKLT